VAPQVQAEPPARDRAASDLGLRIRRAYSPHAVHGQFLPGFQTHIRRIRAIFPKPLTFRSSFQDAVGDMYLEPRVVGIVERLLRFRQLQHGQMGLYILYILLALLLVFVWMLVRARFLG